jgi:hypothetical protein
MAYKVRFLPDASLDMQVAADWYDEQSRGLGLKFIRSIKAKIKILKTNPLIYVRRYRQVHTAVVDVFPYMIHFEFFPDEHLVIITSIMHTSLSPKKWLRR